jgi:hypothetical protein
MIGILIGNNIINAQKPIDKSPEKLDWKERRLGPLARKLANLRGNLSGKEALALIKQDALDDFAGVLIPANESVVLSTGRHDKSYMASWHNEEGPFEDKTVGADCTGGESRSASPAKAKLQTTLGFEPLSSFQKPVQQHEILGPDGWLCPRSSKRKRVTSKQISLDRWAI